MRIPMKRKAFKEFCSSLCDISYPITVSKKWQGDVAKYYFRWIFGVFSPKRGYFSEKITRKGTAEDFCNIPLPFSME